MAGPRAFGRPARTGNVRALTAIDWIIVGFTLLMAVWGYTLGLVASGLALAGFAGGAFLGARLGPLLLDEGSKSQYAPVFALGGALLVGGLVASILQVFGFQIRRRLRGGLEAVDGLGGALLLACVGLGAAWITGAVAVQSSDSRDLRRDVQDSTILRALNETLPPSGPLLNALRRFDPAPAIEGPEANVEAPDSAIARDPDVEEAGRSVVRVLGTACGLGVQGSGWIVGEGLVVTNAHVVAGQDDTVVEIQGEGPSHDAEAVHFDPDNDLAILRSSGVSGVPPLRLNTGADVGTASAILGFPRNGDYTVRPARLGPTRTVVSQNAYGEGPVRRRITSFRGVVRSGNSGGPVVDDDGRVVTTVFAAAVGSEEDSGLGLPDSELEEALSEIDGRVGTGPCTG